MNVSAWWGIIGVLFIVIVVLAWVLFASPTPVSAPTVIPPTEEAKSTPTPTASSEPLHARVSVTSPKSGALVGKTFTVSGFAPGPWFFEASFPIQVRDNENSKIGQGIAQAQGDWMTTGLVPFSVTITVNNYSGPAMLVLLRDNPSGLPENDDSFEIPIVIQ